MDHKHFKLILTLQFLTISLTCIFYFFFAAQDAGLDALAAVISRQKIMGQEIGNELDEHNEIIDDLAHLVDKTDDRIRNETRRVKLVETKSASCGMLVVIVLLLIAIIVVAAWPV